MKIIILILIFTSQLLPQNNLILLLGGDDIIDPLTYDANVLALYDGDVGLTTSTWEDQLSTNDITLTGAPNINTTAINSHTAVEFNGSDEFGVTATPVTEQPYTMYIVMREITYTNADALFDDGVTSTNKRLYQDGLSPNLTFRTGTAVLLTNEPAVGDWFILTIVVNGASSSYRWGISNATTVDFGALDGAGITLAARTLQTSPGNVAFAYLILRSGADDTTTQNAHIKFLQSRFAL